MVNDLEADLDEKEDLLVATKLKPIFFSSGQNKNLLSGSAGSAADSGLQSSSGWISCKACVDARMLFVVGLVLLPLCFVYCSKKADENKVLRDAREPMKEVISSKPTNENQAASSSKKSNEEELVTDPEHPEDQITRPKDKKKLSKEEDNRTTWARYALERPCRRLVKQYKLKLKKFMACGKDGRPLSTAVCEAKVVKNRYSDVACLDSSRVVLKRRTDDYINASWFMVPDNSVKYICTQGPLKETIEDFWCMTYQENVKMVIMLCQLVEGSSEKCSIYWPLKLGDSEVYGNYTVRQTEQCPEPLEGVALTCFEVQFKKEEPRKIWHLLVPWWPDQLAPSSATPMLEFHKWVKKNNESGRPIIVHCSAGVGRTSTFVGFDYALQRIREDFTVELMDIVKEMRTMRSQAIQSHVQYIFLHLLLFQSFLDEGVLKMDDRLAKFIEDYTKNANKRLKKRKEDDEKCSMETKVPIRRKTREEIEDG